MKCPFCLHIVAPSSTVVPLGDDSKGRWELIKNVCPNPACGRFYLALSQTKYVGIIGGVKQHIGEEKVYEIFPKPIPREPAKTCVPKKFSEDYNEACLVLNDSPKASAALGRRCLQNLLREIAKVKTGDLSKEIQEMLESGKLPSHLSEGLDAIRHIGNFATHPVKSQSSGEIVPVEPGEAEWTLDTLEGLFDFYFVQPELTKKKRESLNKKLADAGKHPLK